MMTKFLPLGLAATLLASTQAADSATRSVTSRLMVHIPHSLFRDQGYEHREALFGTPPYGGSIAQTLYYADSELCDNVDPTKGFPTREGNTPWQAPFILMVDRGGCTFVKKVRNAQRAGAAGVIIADNVCLCTDPECKNEFSTTCETSEPIMADDGSGSDISIPSFLIFKRDADLIKTELKNNSPVQLEMSWSLPSPDDTVEYDLWTVPTDPLSKTFMQNFRPLANALGTHAQFTPHMYIYDGQRTHCIGNDGANYCYTLCTNNGRYCATDPDNDLDKGISGADVVKESLRRICIWKYYGEEDGVGDPWWAYVSEFTARCDTPEYFMHDDCINDAYQHAGIDADAISKCMRDSGGTEGDNDNSYLKMAISSQSERGVVVLPSAFVNNAAIRGKLSSSSIFHAICAGFAEGTEPDICNSCGRCPDAIGCVNSGVCAGTPYNPAARGAGGSTPAGTVSTHTFAFWMLFVVAAFGGVGYWHYNKTREDMREQVRGILAEYMPLEDQDGGNPMDFAGSKSGTVPLFS
eukprot:CAMPEP_0113653108 /NCGR_PEP_ID=MMETSP0017_2-20120614/28389_1 /TAXON_ID=2856 /ORGANISM="Cylindrotheca closterium" /LENGTH=522 /DNA_ID=CAMNT_0000566051 /DNA_START=268 /DNA_END=1836 /DNA_ORIENTATION=- /assembly_acc=CAM_ASM_000147